MEINAVELIKFLGHSSIHEPFDDYLHAHGIKKRPNVGRDYAPYIEIKKQGLLLNFLISSEVAEKGVRAKTPGNYIFNWLDIYIKKEDGYSPYKGPFANELRADLSQQQVRRLYGQPKHVTSNPERNKNVDFFYVDGFVLVIHYSDMQGNTIETINYRLPDNWARANGIAPKL